MIKKKNETENGNRTHESEWKREALHRLIEARTIENEDKALADVRLIRNINIYTYILGFEFRVPTRRPRFELELNCSECAYPFCNYFIQLNESWLINRMKNISARTSSGLVVHCRSPRRHRLLLA